MSQIEIRCVDQTAMFTNLPEIFSGDVNVDTVKFTFDDSWNGYTTKTAVFYNNPKDVYPQILDVNDVAVIPSQVMTKQCKLSIGVFGTKANGDVKTSKILTYNVGKGAINSDLESTPATPDFWTQLLSRQINFENTINTKVDTFQTTVNSKVDGLETNVDTVEAIAKGRNQALAYNSYSEMITALNSMTKDELKRGQNIYIGTVGVPDLWVYGVETTKTTYTYTNDETIINGLNNNVTVQVGYYKLAQLETQKVDVGGINADINGLRSDVETLNSDFDTLLAKPDNSLLWNISDEIKSEIEESGISIPDENLEIFDMIYYNNKLYLLAYKSSASTTYLYIYSEGTWTNATGYAGACICANFQVLNDELYYVKTGNKYIELYKLGTNPSNNTLLESFSYSENIYGYLCKDSVNNLLYLIWNRYNTQYIYYITYDGSSFGNSGSTTQYSTKANVSYLNSAEVNNGKIKTNFTFVNSSYGNQHYEDYYNTSKYRLFSKKRSDTYKNMIVKKINNHKYVIDVSGDILDVSTNNKEISCMKYADLFCEYDNNLLVKMTFDLNLYITKFYRVATSYATKGTKICLSGNHKPLTNNLQAIDGGYEVTSDGEVKIALYE